MPIRIRNLKNRGRGTEITYATIPIEEASNPDMAIPEINLALERVYGKGKVESDYDTVSFRKKEYQERMGSFLKDPTRKEMLMRAYKIDDKGVVQYHGGKIYFTFKKGKNQLLITPAPVVHNIAGSRMEEGGLRRYDLRKKEGITLFDDLMSILNSGFSKGKYNSDSSNDPENAFVKSDKRHRFNYAGGANYRSHEKGITNGDMYSIEIFPKKGLSLNDSSLRESRGEIEHLLLEGKKEDIVSVNIDLNKDSSQEEIETKMKFYKENITTKYGVPVKFFVSETMEDKYGQEIEPKSSRMVFPKKTLEHRVTSVIAIGSLIVSILFMSNNLTGNAIASLNQTSSNWSGGILFIIGLVASLVYFKRK